MERELKLEIEKVDIEKLRLASALTSLQIEPPHGEELTGTYFDTPDHYLRRHGLSLRVRAGGETRLQTLKDNGRMCAGLYERAEYETPVHGDAPDLLALIRAVPRSSRANVTLGQDDLAAKLTPIFTTRVERTLWLLRLPQGADIELALDEGTVESENASVSFQEVEMELKSGEVYHLYGLALELLGVVPMHFGYRTKGDRGYALLEEKDPAVRQQIPNEPVRARPIELKKRYRIERALDVMARNCIAQIQGNEPGVVLRENAASVHQMRVGLRRLRSVFDLVESWIEAPSQLRDELTWIAGELGHARDWHVLAHNTLPHALKGVEHDADILQLNAEERARQNQQRSSRAAGSARYAKLMIEMLLWLDRFPPYDDEPGSPKASRAPLKKIADRVLRTRHRKLMKRGRHLPDLEARKRHRARIAAKKLRYATEFFAALYPKRTMRRYASALSKLQDDLGWRNDAVAADGLLDRMASEHPGTRAGAQYVRGFLAAQVAADYSALHVLWKRFKRLSYIQ